MDINWRYWITIGGIIIISYFTSFIIRRVLSKIIRKRSDLLKADPTKFVFLKNSASLIIYSIALIFIFLLTPKLNDIGKGLFAGAGIMAAILGFASQKAFANILSGIFILIFKPFGVNDTLEIKSEGNKGVVEEITLRHTIIRDYENRRIVIPNSVISESTLVNSSLLDEKIRKHVEFGISYDSDIDLARSIIVDEIIRHPKYLDNRTEEEIKQSGGPYVLVRVVALADFSIQLKAYVWALTNDDAFEIYCDILESVKKRFDKEGIEIPFPHRTLGFKNPLDINEKAYKES